MFAWTERRAREAVDVWGVHPKSMCPLSWSWQQAGFLIRISTSPSSITLASVYTHTDINNVCLFMTKHINTPDSRRLCIICLHWNYFIPQSSASRSASDDMSDYFELLLHLWALQPAQAALRLLERYIYTRWVQIQTFLRIRLLRRTVLGPPDNWMCVKVEQTRDYCRKWQMAWVTGGTGLRQQSHDSLLFRRMKTKILVEMQIFLLTFVCCRDINDH